MTKKKQPINNDRKGFLALAGEAFHVLGEEIVEVKDKVVAASGDKLTKIKKAVSNLTHKKKVPAKPASKKVAKKGTVKKVIRKSPSKAARAKKV
jgi:hypothetical protein